MGKYLLGFGTGMLIGAVGLGVVIVFMIEEDPAWCHEYVDAFNRLMSPKEDREKQES